MEFLGMEPWELFPHGIPWDGASPGSPISPYMEFLGMGLVWKLQCLPPWNSLGWSLWGSFSHLEFLGMEPPWDLSLHGIPWDEASPEVPVSPQLEFLGMGSLRELWCVPQGIPWDGAAPGTFPSWNSLGWSLSLSSFLGFPGIPKDSRNYSQGIPKGFPEIPKNFQGFPAFPIPFGVALLCSSPWFYFFFGFYSPQASNLMNNPQVQQL